MADDLIKDLESVEFGLHQDSNDLDGETVRKAIERIRELEKGEKLFIRLSDQHIKELKAQITQLLKRENEPWRGEDND